MKKENIFISICTLAVIVGIYWAVSTNLQQSENLRIALLEYDLAEARELNIKLANEIKRLKGLLENSITVPSVDR